MGTRAKKVVRSCKQTRHTTGFFRWGEKDEIKFIPGCLGTKKLGEVATGGGPESHSDCLQGPKTR